MPDHHPDSDLRPYAGAARRETVEMQIGLGPWQGATKVSALIFHGGRRRFELAVSWTGPGLPGLPPSPTPVDVSDVIVVDELWLARYLAGAAAELLKEPQVPLLGHLRQAITEGKLAWRRHYHQLVGDAGRAAARGDPIL